MKSVTVNICIDGTRRNPLNHVQNKGICLNKVVEVLFTYALRTWSKYFLKVHWTKQIWFDLILKCILISLKLRTDKNLQFLIPVLFLYKVLVPMVHRKKNLIQCWWEIMKARTNSTKVRTERHAFISLIFSLTNK